MWDLINLVQNEAKPKALWYQYLWLEVSLAACSA